MRTFARFTPLKKWTAGALGFQPRLGPAWFHVLDYPIYKPWRLFQWWYAYEVYATDIFNRAGLIVGGMLGTAAAIAGSVWHAHQSNNVITYGSARWGSTREAADVGLLQPSGVFLRLLNKGYLRHDGPEHVMVFAPTRSDKGVGLAVPTLLAWTGGAVIHDVKGENWSMSWGYT